jgi:hypothetical protein
VIGKPCLQQGLHTFGIQFPESTGKIAKTQQGASSDSGIRVLSHACAKRLGPSQVGVVQRYRQDDAQQQFRARGGCSPFSFLVRHRVNWLVTHYRAPLHL